MKVALDVAQTCVERAGCGWYADGVACALGRRADLAIELFHHFGNWCNESTDTGTSIAGCAEPVRRLTSNDAREFWARVPAGGLPSRPDIAHSTSFEAPEIPGTRLVFTFFDASFWTHPEFTTETNRIICQRGVLDALQRAAAFAFISESSRDDFETALPGWLEESARPFAVIPPASRFPAEQVEAPPRPDSPWVCVGSVEPRKNHATLLAAYAKYRRLVPNGRPLSIVGGHGWSSADVHETMERMKGPGGVTYLGYVTDAELAKIYRGAFAVLQSSWHEGFGLPLLEAMNFGLPVLCSDIASHREVGRNAPIYCPPGNASAWADAMVHLDSTPEAWLDQADRSWTRQSAYSWDQSASQAVDLYRRVMDAFPK